VRRAGGAGHQACFWSLEHGPTGLTVHTTCMTETLSEDAGAHSPALERFPFTKFLPPALDERVVTDHLVDRLEAANSTRPLTVVTAPAGSGKTTALAAWAAAVAADVVWVRIGPDDNEPTVLAAALLEGGRRQLGNDFGGRLAQLLAHAGPAPTPGQLVTALVNDLGDHGAVTLVLDDLHEVTDGATSAFLDELIEHLPSDVRVVIGSRTEPELSLARRRVRGEVAELGLADLRLDEQAIRQVLGRDGAVDDDAVSAVARASRGWAAAVRLAAAGFGGGWKAGADPTSAAQPDVWRFLAEEVFASQPDDVRAFLLDTSILEELTPQVCEHVTGRSDAAAMLTVLERRQLFVSRFAGSDGPAWRYHDLFADFLHDRLQEERGDGEVVDGERRAADALPPALAVPHLLAVGDHAQVATVAADVAFAHLDNSVIVAVAPWIRELPSELIEGDHRLAVLLAWRDEIDGRLDDIVARLKPLHRHLMSTGDELAATEVGLQLAVPYIMQGDLDEAGKLLDGALDQPLEGWARIAAVAIQMWWARGSGDWTEASRMLAEGFEQTRHTVDLRGHRVFATAMSSVLLFADQGPAWVGQQTRHLAARLDGNGSTLSLTALRPVLAGAAWLERDIAGATVEVRQCLDESTEFGGLATVHQDAEILLLALSLLAEDHATIRVTVDGAIARMETSPFDATLRALYASAAARSAWLRGDRAHLAATIDLLGDPERPEDEIVRTVAELLQARGDGGGGGFSERLADAEAMQRDHRCWFGAGRPGLERATLLLEEGRTMAAVEAAEPTLAAGAEYGAGLLLPDATWHVPLLEACARAGNHPQLVGEVLEVLERRSAPAAAAIPGTSERLSVRELEVLALVAAGGSNRDIAAELYISEVTVKSHLTRILRKLDATSRTHAVARARELHLL
jgi:LuxR family transcriptional regulator, maltose regulon positive regulatory protein